MKSKLLSNVVNKVNQHGLNGLKEIFVLVMVPWHLNLPAYKIGNFELALERC